MTTPELAISRAADHLARLFEAPFGGKPKGRYRIAAKLVRQILQRRRLYDDDIRNLTRELLERGFVLIDMDGFFVVLGANSFVNYRRANEESLR
jgi:hypothetical protein|tara:strand:- start:28351 stop:28632 length:282 start_codon:yes stop_codon:yes gene_type:complete